MTVMITAPDGLVTPHETRLVTPDGHIPVSAIRAHPAGYSTVATMLGHTPFYIAHRGGSAEWAEMSMHAYTQSTWFGAGAIEISVAKSSDGVYFGLHDEDLQRTSPGAPATPAASLDWATIDSYQITAPGGQPSQPYARLSDILDTYLPSHVVFIDPKYIPGGQLDAFISWLVTEYPNATDRIVGKGYGVSNLWPTALAAAGLASWGYFYETDLANLPTYAPKWTLVGMSHSASQPTWDAIKSHGRPVIGHICASPSDATTALAKGADGLMCARIRGIVPS